MAFVVNREMDVISVSEKFEENEYFRRSVGSQASWVGKIVKRAVAIQPGRAARSGS